MNKQYKYSEILELQNQNEFAILYNIITKEKFRITLKSANIIKYLQKIEKFTFKEIKEKFDSIDNIELNNFFKFLIFKRFILDIEDDPKILTIKPVFSLFNYNIGELFEVKDSIVVLGIPFGKGNTVDIDTFLYPNSIRTFTSKYGIKYEVSEQVFDVGNIYFYENEYNFISYQKIEKIVEILSSNRNKIFSLGGDHSITYPIIKSLAKHNDKINIIHLDAHTDCYKSSIHDLHEKHDFCSHHHGNFLERILNLENVNKIYQFGIRSVKQETANLNEKIVSFNCTEINKFISCLSEISKDIPTYVTFDIDIINPIYAPATATPVINGLEVNEILYLLDKLIERKLNILGIDIVEINPNKDIGGITTQLSIIIIQKLLQIIK